MNTIFEIVNLLQGFYKRKKLVQVYFYLGFAALILLAARQLFPVVNSEGRYLFFLWNLFLAMIPLGISTVMLNNVEANKGRQNLLLGIVWLIFFPNAPYILTDYVHVKDGDHTYFFLNFITWAYFAIISFAAALISLEDISQILSHRLKPAIVSLLMPSLCLLTGFGIYLGRDLRFNSWDIFTKPHVLISESVNTLSHGDTDFFNWVAASSISLLLYLLYLMLRLMKKEDQTLAS